LCMASVEYTVQYLLIVAPAVEEKAPVQQSVTQNTNEETVKKEVPVNDLRAKMMRMTNR